MTITPEKIHFLDCTLTVTPDGIGVGAREDRADGVRLSFKFDANASAAQFTKFLDETLGSDTKGRAAQQLLQEFVGACLIGAAARLATALLLGGEGPCGKSTLAKVFAALFTEFAASVPPSGFDLDYGRRLLPDARINIAQDDDTPLDAVDLASFKAIVSGDPIVARAPGEKPFEFSPKAGHIFFASTPLPSRIDTSRGVWRMIRVIRFAKPLPLAARDPRLVQKLTSIESLQGIALWALRGAVDVLQRGEYACETKRKAHTSAELRSVQRRCRRRNRPGPPAPARKGCKPK